MRTFESGFKFKTFVLFFENFFIYCQFGSDLIIRQLSSTHTFLKRLKVQNQNTGHYNFNSFDNNLLIIFNI